MRRRLLWSSLASVAVAIVLLGIPLAGVLRGVLTDQAIDALTREAGQVRALLEREAGSGRDAATLLELVGAETGAHLALVDRVGLVGSSGELETGRELADRALLRALQGEAVTARQDGVLVVAVPAVVGGSPHALRIVRPDESLRAEVRRAWLAIGGLAALALGGAAVLASWQGRRLARPLEELADAAQRLGEGDFSARGPESRLPEVDRVSNALDATADRLASALERSRSFGADASHQLRTPLTALRLDLEALPDSEPVRAALEEADRLEATIDELAALGSVEPTEEPVDLAALVGARLEAWRALASRRGRPVRLEAADVPPVRARPEAIGQALQVLLDNAFLHGRGPITVRLDTATAEGRSRVRVAVLDEGEGIRSGAPEGRGLALARALVEAEGGRLVLDSTAQGGRACLVLPGASAS